MSTETTALELDPETAAYYCRALAIMQRAGVPFLVGGAYAFERYTGIARHTKDFDVFVRRRDLERVLETFKEDDFQTELIFPHWLAKAFCGEDFIDVIFSSGNGVADVDDAWFQNAIDQEVFGTHVKLCPPEEMIWQKAFIMERERFDGADVAHLLRACAQEIDWERLLERFGDDWRVLFSHLVLFGFIYPAERSKIPGEVMQALMQRLEAELTADSAERLCQGTLLSRAQYLVDVNRWGYQDARVAQGRMEPEDVAHWTAAIDRHA